MDLPWFSEVPRGPTWDVFSEKFPIQNYINNSSNSYYKVKHNKPFLFYYTLLKKNYKILKLDISGTVGRISLIFCANCRIFSFLKLKTKPLKFFNTFNCNFWPKKIYTLENFDISGENGCMASENVFFFASSELFLAARFFLTLLSNVASIFCPWVSV